jgi:AcrR family transcriptional regulator
MSKATFYEHFDNKEDCIVALFDWAAGAVINAMREASAPPGLEPVDRYRAAIAAFLHALSTFPDESQTLLVEIIGAGPRAMERRDRVLEAFADYIDATNEADAADGTVPRLPASRTPSRSWARSASSCRASCARGARRRSPTSSRSSSG